MDCKEAEKLIPQFIKNECTSKENAQLIEHIQSCPDCKEELTIQFLLDEGLNRLEAGESFDLNAELERKLKEGSKKTGMISKIIHSEITKIIADILLVLIMAGLIVALLMWKIQ